MTTLPVRDIVFDLPEEEARTTLATTCEGLIDHLKGFDAGFKLTHIPNKPNPAEAKILERTRRLASIILDLSDTQK